METELKGCLFYFILFIKLKQSCFTFGSISWDLLSCAIVFYINDVQTETIAVFYIGDAICVFINIQGSGIPYILLSVSESLCLSSQCRLGVSLTKYSYLISSVFRQMYCIYCIGVILFG